MGFFRRISTTFKTNENAASDKAEDSNRRSNQINADKQKPLVTTKQHIATPLSQRDPIEKLNLMDYSFNALTYAGVQTVGELLKLVESGEHRTIHGLRSTSILEIEVKLAQLEIVDDSEVDANTDTIPDQNDVPLLREVPLEKSSLTQPPPNQLHVDSQAVREVEQQVESGESTTISENDANVDTVPDQNDVPLSQEDAIEESSLPQHSPNPLIHTESQAVGEGTQHVESGAPQTISEVEANIDTTPDQNDISLSREDSIERMSLTQHTRNLLKHTDIRTVGDLLQWVESGRLQTIPALGRISILEIEDELSRVPALDDSGVDANSDAIPDQNDVPFSREDSTKKIRLTQDALNRLKHTDVRTVGQLLQWVESGESQTIAETEADANETPGQNDVSLSREASNEEQNLTQHTNPQTIREDEQQVESTEPQIITEVEADADVIPDQNDTYLSRGDAIEKLNLSKPSFNVLTRIGIRTVAEVLQLFELARLNMIRQAFGSEFTSEIRTKLAQVTILDDSETEANTNTTPDQNDISLSQEDSTEEQSLTEHSPNPLIDTDSQTVGEAAQQVESDELSTTSEGTANANATLDHNDAPLSREDSIEKLRLTQYALNRLKQTDIRTVGEFLQWVESDTTPALGQKSISKIKERLAQAKTPDDSESETNTNTTSDQNDAPLSQEDSAEDPSLREHPPNALTHMDSRTVGEVTQQTESSESQTIDEVEADTNETSDQNGVSLSREDSIEKLNLTEYSFNALTALGVQTVGEVLNLVESGKHRPISTLGRKFILEIEGKLAQVKILDDSETEANADAMPSQDNVSLPQKDLIEEPGLTQHSPNQLHIESQTVGGVGQQVESTEPPTTSEGEANTNVTPRQNNIYLSRGDTIEKLNLSQRSLKALKRADIRLVGELLPRVESGKIRVTRGLGRKPIAEIEEKLAQVKVYDNYAQLSREDSIGQLYLRNRSFNALTRAGIQTIGEVLQLVESDELERISALGRKSIVEIKNKLAQVTTPNDSEGEVNTNSISDRNYLHLLLEDSIDQLNLTPRSFNALTRAGVQTIGEVLQLVESDRLKTTRGLGRKSIVEIKEKFIQPKFLSDSKDEASTDAIPRVVIRSQSELVNKQLLRGLLHEEAIIAEKSIKDWLAEIETIESSHIYEILTAVLGSSLNICEEIEFFLNQIPSQYRMTILLSAHGFETKTLAQTGDELGISRERVRQLRNELKNKATSLSNLKDRPTLLRMQSALLIARDLGMDITYEQWTQRIRASGLVGHWTSQDFVETDAVEVMIAICNLLADCDTHWLQIPENLRHAIQSVTADIPDAPAEIPDAFETLPSEVRRLINGHTKNSGGVHLRWLSQESGMELQKIKNVLQQQGYRALSEDWFIPTVLDNPHQTSHRDICHRCLDKMLQYCGPLTIDDICGGLRHVLSRTKFPVPPPGVIAEIARMHNYKREAELYYWEGTYDENLKKSKGETIIMNCLEQIGPVLHHSELAHAFIESDLSYPSLHSTLQRSPLFERIEFGLYKLRGKQVTYQDIERAKITGEQQPLRPEIEYDTNGNIIVSVTLGTIAVGSGTIVCERFPDLSGADWECYVGSERAGELSAVENEFRRLKKSFELLNCQPGERVKFTFNTWERTVEIEKEAGNAEN